MQNNEVLYAINETALHNRILSKKRSAGHIANFSELLSIFVNMGTGMFVLVVALFKSANIFMYLMAAWMLITALYSLVSRVRRLKKEHQFDRSMLGDLNHAISNARYQVWLSRILLWNAIPLGILVFLSLWDNGKLSVWVLFSLLLFFVFSMYAGRWEHGIYKKRQRELEALHNTLMNEG